MRAQAGHYRCGRRLDTRRPTCSLRRRSRRLPPALQTAAAMAAVSCASGSGSARHRAASKPPPDLISQVAAKAARVPVKAWLRCRPTGACDMQGHCSSWVDGIAAERTGRLRAADSSRCGAVVSDVNVLICLGRSWLHFCWPCPGLPQYSGRRVCEEGQAAAAAAATAAAAAGGSSVAMVPSMGIWYGWQHRWSTNYANHAACCAAAAAAGLFTPRAA